MTDPLYKRSVVMIILGGACLSLLGISTRLMDGATGPQIAFYRAISQAVFFFCVLVWMERQDPIRSVRAISIRGWIVAALIAAAAFLIIMAMLYTTVANTVFIISLTPVCSAILAWLFLKERVNRRTAMAIVIAIIGVAIIFGTNISPTGLIGMGFAFAMMLCYSSAIVIIRTIPHVSMIALCAISGLILAVAMLPIIGEFGVTTKDLIICLGLGIVQAGLGMVLITSGARHVPAAQVSLLAMSEVVLSPLWVWIGVGEQPGVFTLIGGAIVLSGVVLLALGGDGGNLKPNDFKGLD